MKGKTREEMKALCLAKKNNIQSKSSLSNTIANVDEKENEKNVAPTIEEIHTVENNTNETSLNKTKTVSNEDKKSSSSSSSSSSSLPSLVN
ncbi:hypothetical protein C1645_757701, partial [Glomus cerebriforme]